MSNVKEGGGFRAVITNIIELNKKDFETYIKDIT